MQQSIKGEFTIKIPEEYVLIKKDELDKLKHELKQECLKGKNLSMKDIEKSVNNTKSELLEVAEVAKRLKCNRNKVYELIKSGQLQALKLGRMKVSTLELDDFLRRNVGKDLSDPFNVKELI